MATDMKSQPKVLVTGATGFIGRHLCVELLNGGYCVRAAYRGEIPPDRDSRIEWSQIGEVGENTDWKAALDDIDYVVHLAGLAHRVGVSDEILGAQFHEVNALGTRRLAECVAKNTSVRRLLFVSSIAALPAPHLGRPENEYGVSKRLAERYVEQLLSGPGSDWCILRPCLVYGSGNPGNMERLLRLINTGLPLPFGAIHNRRSFIFVGNLTSGIRHCLSHPAARKRAFNISDTEPVSTPNLLRLLGKHSHRKVRLVPAPLPFLRMLGCVGDTVKRGFGISTGFDSYSIAKLCNSLTVDCSEIRDTGWNPPYSVEEGIRMMMHPTN